MHRSPIPVFRLLSTVSCLLLSVLTLAAKPVKFDIAAQSAADALLAFSKQAGVDVLYSHKDLSSVRSQAVQGEFEPEPALAVLLRGTGYSAKRDTAGKFVVASAASAKGSLSGSLMPSRGGGSVAKVSVTVLETGERVPVSERGLFKFPQLSPGTYTLVASGEGFSRLRITDVVVRAGVDTALGPQELPVVRSDSEVQTMKEVVVSAKKDIETLAAVEVSGERLRPFATANVDLPRTVNDVQPYYIFDASMIENTPATNLEDFLKQRLTMNTTAAASSQSAVGFGGSGRANNPNINLNGLGFGTVNHTLILVNGHRLATDAAVGLNGYQPDINGIPLSAVDRVEVLPTSASGIYGGSALGGVVNIVLKQNYSGGEIRTTYSNPFDSDAPNYRIDLSYGFTIRGKTQVMLTGSYADGRNLTIGDRAEIIQSRINGMFQRSSARFLSTTPFMGALPNITVLTGALNGYTAPTQTSLVLKDGRSLNSLFTFVPAGTAPTTPTATLAAGLLANAGKQNLELGPTYSQSSGLLSTVGFGAPRSRSFGATVRHQVTPRIEAFAEFGLSSTISLGRGVVPSSSGVSVPGNLAMNPFQQNVRIVFPHTGYGPYSVNSLTRNLTAGVKFKLPHEWNAEIDYTWSFLGRSSVLTTGADTTYQLSLVVAGAFNPFVDTVQNPLKLPADLRQAFYTFTPSTVNDVALRASGPVARLPGGTPTLTFGAEHRKEGFGKNGSTVLVAATPATNSITMNFGQYQKVSSLYAEADIPLVGPKQQWTGVNALNLQIAGRVERFVVPTRATSYTVNYATGAITPPALGYAFLRIDKYTSSNPTYGLLYRPVADVALRASYSTAFLPPGLGQLVPAQTPSTTTTTIFDPRTNTNYGVFTIGGGNPTLKPQTTESWNVGAIYQPRSGPWQGLRLNLEFQKTRESDLISSLTAQQLINLESEYPGRITRDAAGRITLVNTGSLNLYFQEIKQVTGAANYVTRTRWGSFDFGAAGTYFPFLLRQTSIALPVLSYAGYVHAGGPNKLKGNATLNWERGRWAAGWLGTYFGSYYTTGAPGDPGYKSATTAAAIASLQLNTVLQGASSVPSQIYHQVFARYRFGESGAGRRGWGLRALSNVTAQLTIKNALNTTPPFDYFYEPYYYSPYGDLRGREYVLSLKKQF